MSDEDGTTGRFFIEFPDDWDDLSEEEQDQVALEMAREAQRQLGIEPNA